jgi:hypothetical protein
MADTDFLRVLNARGPGLGNGSAGAALLVFAEHRELP